MLLCCCGGSPVLSNLPTTATGAGAGAELESAGLVADSTAETPMTEPETAPDEAEPPGAEAPRGSAAAPGAEPDGIAPEGTSARLPAESIQTVVHWNLGRFRGCYQEALRRYPGLQGRVAARFVVDGQGNVTDAIVAESDVPEPVSWCILTAFRQLRFPVTHGGNIAVTYPFRLTPTGLLEAGVSSKPNAPTPRARRARGGAPPNARNSIDRLFVLFLEGSAGDGPTVQPTSAAAASGPRAPEPPLPTDGAGGAASRDGSAAERQTACHPGDPLCSDI